RYINYCPDGWSYYKLNCFKYFSDARTWDEAERQCQAIQDGAHLAWVEDQREAITLREAISYYQRVQPVWIGLHYSEEVRQGLQGSWGTGGQQSHASEPHLSSQSQAWKWAGGDTYSVASGLSGSSARAGKCGMLTHQSSFSLWSSANCAQKHHYICKFTP
ncbi:REG4 protein, partial [Pachyramphus minor]|nr:REG4 protein [Pachyramphus minor]